MDMECAAAVGRAGTMKKQQVESEPVTDTAIHHFSINMTLIIQNQMITSTRILV